MLHLLIAAALTRVVDSTLSQFRRDRCVMISNEAAGAPRKGLSSNIPAVTFLSKPNVDDRVIVAAT